MKIEFELPEAASDERQLLASAILQIARNADVQVTFEPYVESGFVDSLIKAGIPDDCFTEERLLRKA